MTLDLRVTVIGGGIIGASAAWHLTRAGVRSVTVLDRGTVPGTGSTGRATGGYRATFATEPNIRLSLLARDTLRIFADELGCEPVYQPVGYLWITRSPEMLTLLQAANRLQRSLGLEEATVVAADDVYRLNRWVGHDDTILGALWCPTDGYVQPLAMLAGYRAAAERAGARFQYGRSVIGLLTAAAADGTVRLTGVATDGGVVESDLVVNAAGPWAAAVASWVGFDLPVVPLRRQVAITSPTQALPADMPMTLWADDGFHMRVREGRVLYAWPTPGDPGDPWSTSVDDDWVAATERTAHERVPVLRGVPVDRRSCWAGLYESSPDRRPIIGRTPGCPDLLLANGSSGHGVMHSAAIGRLIAELATGAAPSLPMEWFDPARFQRGGPLGEELL